MLPPYLGDSGGGCYGSAKGAISDLDGKEEDVAIFEQDCCIPLKSDLL